MLMNLSRVMKRWVDMYSQGRINPIRPMAVFESKDVEQSFRHLQKGVHIGKAVVSIPKDLSTIPSTLSARPFSLDPEAAYLLTGGLGGLGRSVASWMVERGARNLIFLSRSAGQNEMDKTFFAELRTMGCSVVSVAGKAENMGDIHRCVLKASKPVKGVLHLAMVLKVFNHLSHRVDYFS